LIGGLGGEKDRWTAHSNRLSQLLTEVTGNVLVSAGLIAYLGTWLLVLVMVLMLVLRLVDCCLCLLSIVTC
jgi:hypothetical protein